MRWTGWMVLWAGCTQVVVSDDPGLDDTDVACGTVAPTFGSMPDPSYAGPPELRFLAVDNGRMELVLVDEMGGEGWSSPLPVNPRDISRVVGGGVLISHELGAVRVDLATGEETWRVDSAAGVTSATALANCHVLLGAQAGPDVALIEVDEAGVEVSRVLARGYADLRLVRRLDDGHTLFTASEPYRVVEVDALGAEVWSAPLPGKGYLAERLPGGNTLATTGGDVRLVELTPDGDLVHTWGGSATFPELGLDWFSGFQMLDGDVAVVTNWLGHDTTRPGPQLVAFDADNTLVWSWDDRDAVTQVTNVLVLDARGF